MSFHLEKTQAQLDKRSRLARQNMADLTYQTLESGLGICGSTVNPHPQMYHDIANLINNFTSQSETRGQMLEKSTKDIEKGFYENRSIILVHPDYVPDGVHQQYLALSLLQLIQSVLTVQSMTRNKKP